MVNEKPKAPSEKRDISEMVGDEWRVVNGELRAQPSAGKGALLIGLAL
jgi:hypothetical protein